MSRARSTFGLIWPVDLAGVGICLALTLLLFFAAIKPMRRQHALHLEAQAELDRGHDQATRLAAAAEVMELRLEAIRSDNAAAPVQLESLRQLNSRLAELTSLAVECGLVIDVTGHGQPHSGPWFRTVPIKFVGQGTFPTCTIFLDRLRRTFGDMGVASFDLSGAPAVGAVAQFRFNLVWHTEPGKRP